MTKIDQVENNPTTESNKNKKGFMDAWEACKEELKTQLHPIAIRLKRTASRRLSTAPSASTETETMRIKVEPVTPQNVTVRKPSAHKSPASSASTETLPRLKIKLKDDAPNRVTVRKVRRASNKNILPTVLIKIDAGIPRQKNRRKPILLPTVALRIERKRA